MSRTDSIEIWTARDIGRGDAPTSLKCILAWIEQYTAQSHSALGRPGAVCPYVPAALEQQSLWLVEVASLPPALQTILETIRRYRLVYEELLHGTIDPEL